MKKFIKKIINKILSYKGSKLVKTYELEHRQAKYIESIEQIESFFHEKIFSDVNTNKYEKILLSQLYGTSLCEAYYIIHFLRKSLKITGDVCEFGIANGSTSALLAYEIKKLKKNLWLFDSFNGLSKPTKKDILLDDIFKLGSMDRYFRTMSYSVDEVMLRLKETGFPLSKVKIVCGFIEDSVHGERLPNKICFAYLDFDLYQPTLTALNFIHERLSKDGYVIVDDYNYFSKGVKTAVDEFVSSKKGFYDFFLPYAFAGHFCIIRKSKH